MSNRRYLFSLIRDLSNSYKFYFILNPPTDEALLPFNLKFIFRLLNFINFAWVTKTPKKSAKKDKHCIPFVKRVI